MTIVSLPSGSAWVTSSAPLPSLGLVGLGNPAAVVGATRQEFATGFSTAIGGLSADVKADISSSNPTIGVAVDGAQAIIRAATGQAPGAAMAFGVAKTLADMMTTIAFGSGALDTVAKGVADVVGDMGEAIPLIGNLVVAFIDFVGGAVGAIPISPQEHQVLLRRFVDECKDIAKRVRGTDPGGVGPADLFAQGDGRTRVWRLLAGGAARSPGMRATYNNWLPQAQKKYGITGIPLHIQRQMVKLMDGIYAARRSPDALGAPIVTDNGRTLFPILLEITLKQGPGYKKAWSKDSVISLADSFVAPGKKLCTKGLGMRAGLACETFGPCRTVGVDIGTSFYEMIRQWRFKSHDPSMLAAARRKAMATPKRAKLILAGPGTVRLLSSLVKTEQEATTGARVRTAKWAAGIGVASLGIAAAVTAAKALS